MMRLLRWTAAATLLATTVAPIAQADTLEVNNAVANNVKIIYGSYNDVWVGGGSFDVSKLNSVNLDYLYCVDLDNTIAIPGTYSATTVDTTGVVNGSAVNNASKVAWLLNQYGGVSNTDTQTALQVVIWETIYDGTFDLSSGNFQLGTGNTSGFNTELAWLTGNITTLGGIGAGNVSQFKWLTPKTGDTNIRQGLVTGTTSSTGVVPEAGSLALLLPGLAPLGLALRRRVQRD